MKYLAPFIFLGINLADPSSSAQVMTGEHGTFTRIVVPHDQGVSWTLVPGLRENEFLMQFQSEIERPELANAFAKINRNRLSGLEWTNRGLEIKISCDCHLESFSVEEKYAAIDVIPNFTLAKEVNIPKMVDPRVIIPMNSSHTTASLIESLEDTKENSIKTNEQLQPPLYRQKIKRKILKGVLSGYLQPDATSKIKPISKFEETAEISTKKESCAQFNISRNQIASDLRSEIATSRAQLVDGTGLPAKADELARLFLAAGLVAEARGTTEFLTKDAASPLLVIADIIETGFIETELAQSLLACDPEAALWSAFSDKLPQGSLNGTEVLSAFDSWPEPLRRILGPELSSRLEGHGLPDASAAILSRLERSPRLDSPAARVETADDPTSLAKLTASADELVAARALGALAEQVQDQNANSAAILAQTLQREHSDTEAEALEIASIVATIASGNYALGFDRALSGEISITENARRRLSRDAMLSAAKDPDNARMLDFILERLDILATHQELPEGPRLSLVARLIDTGLGREAETLLAALSNPATSRERQLLYARAALAAGNAEEAEIRIAGLQGPEADALRLAARIAMGDQDYVIDRLTANEAIASPTDASLRAGRWERLEDAAPASISNAARLAGSHPRLNPQDDTPLSVIDSLLSESEGARDILKGLLAETDPVKPSDGTVGKPVSPEP
ncbi:hypothetical protein [Litorisediminicola beolgyonensis]|uniref:HEAT repeat domain-containing protein n=1 Tax=Litorisediminicola beolgyonensis TaxID=1173614 RepID=A0ABW3ZH92_9RHOB